LTLRNPNPADGEVYYQLGLTLRYQLRFEEAEDAFYKATWSEAWKAPAFFELARLASRRADWLNALALITESLHRNGRHQQASHLRIRILKNLNRNQEASSRVRDALREDPLDFRAAAEAGQTLTPHQSLLLGLDLAHAGEMEAASICFDHAAQGEFLATYLKGWGLVISGNEKAAVSVFSQAARQPLDYAFPNLLEAVPALEMALRLNPKDALAAYALGNFLYGHRRPDVAIPYWELCTQVQPDFATAWRNLGLARMNTLNDAVGAGKALTRAFEANPTDARVLYELDQLSKETAGSPSDRLERLDAHRDLCLSRDDLCVEYLNLLNLTGRHAEALAILTSRVFHPWEGGEGKVPNAYLRARVGLAVEAGAKGDIREARGQLEMAGEWPENLGEGKLGAATENERWWRLGHLLRSIDDQAAEACLERATLGDSEPAGAMYYNDQPAENVFFQGLALRDLGRAEEAKARFDALLAFADAHREDEVDVDYFAVSLPDFLVFDVDLNERNRRHCLFMAALGFEGLGQSAERDKALADLQTACPDHPALLILGC